MPLLAFAEQGVDLVSAVPAVAAKCLHRVQLACVCPTRDRLGIDVEEGRDFARREQRCGREGSMCHVNLLRHEVGPGQMPRAHLPISSAKSI